MLNKRLAVEQKLPIGPLPIKPPFLPMGAFIQKCSFYTMVLIQIHTILIHTIFKLNLIYSFISIGVFTSLWMAKSILNCKYLLFFLRNSCCRIVAVLRSSVNALYLWGWKNHCRHVCMYVKDWWSYRNIL